MQLLFLIALPIFLIYLLHKIRKKSVLPPGPPRLPLIGNLHQFGGAAGNLPFYLWKLSEKHGPLIHLKLGSVPVIVISSAKLAEQVLKTQDLAFCSRPKLLWQNKLTYNYMDMVFSPYGDYWREVRKITAVHLFSLKKIKSFRPIREDEVSRLVKNIGRVSSENGVVHLSDMTMTLGITLICRVAFGRRYEERGPEIRRFEKLLHEANDVMGTFFVSDYLPWLSWVDRVRGAIDKVDKSFENLDSFYQELIDERLDTKRKKKKEEEDDDILDVLIQLKEEGACSIDFNWDQIKALLTDESKRNMQFQVDNDLEEEMMRMEWAIKHAKWEVERAERFAILLNRAIEFKKMSDSEVKNGILQSSAPSINPGATKVEENAIVDDKDDDDDAATSMLKILLPKLFEKK